MSLRLASSLSQRAAEQRGRAALLRLLLLALLCRRSCALLIGRDQVVRKARSQSQLSPAERADALFESAVHLCQQREAVGKFPEFRAVPELLSKVNTRVAILVSHRCTPGSRSTPRTAASHLPISRRSLSSMPRLRSAGHAP